MTLFDNYAVYHLQFYSIYITGSNLNVTYQAVYHLQF